MEFTREVRIAVEFTDRYGDCVTDVIPVYLPEESNDLDDETMIEDVVTQWYYDIAAERCANVWLELGGGTDYEYEEFFDNYLMDCTIFHDFAD